MKSGLKKLLLKLHFIVLIIAVVNAVVKNIGDFSLEESVELGFELFVVVSGLIVFLLYRKQLKRVRYYFSIYAGGALIAVIGLVFPGILGLIVLSGILSPIIPDQKEYEQNGIIISVPHQGFLSRCCQYQVKERKLTFFEKKYKVFETEGVINFETIFIESNENEIIFEYITNSIEERTRMKINKE